MSQPKRPKVLVVDDEVELMRALCDGLAGHDFAGTGLTDPRGGSRPSRAATSTSCSPT